MAHWEKDSDGTWWYYHGTPQKRGRGVVRVCETCEKEFPYYNNKGGGKSTGQFCSRSCKAWKGGVSRDRRTGYLTLWDHDRKRHVAEHRLVMERVLGRRLGRGEHVHHVNGVRDDNRPENLELRLAANHGAGIRMRCAHCGSHDLEAVPLGGDVVAAG